MGGFDPAGEAARCREEGFAILTPADPAFPQFLAATPDPPLALYLRGRLEERPGVAIVGSRRPTAYGRRLARRLASEAARAGLAVVSGLARGIDTEAHEAALEAGGVTWAVLGSGLGRVYPPENRGLADRIVAGGGAVMTEVPLSGAPLAANFPRRNRIVSGLSWLTVVVEADLKSGALITARLAAEQGREVGAVPGPVDSVMSEGPLKLLRDGARPIAGLPDLLEALPPGALAASGLSLECRVLRHEAVTEGGLDGSENPHYKEGAAAARGRETSSGNYKESLGAGRQKILKLMGSGEVAFEVLAQQSGLPVPALLRLLAELEIDGVVEALPGQFYARR